MCHPPRKQPVGLETKTHPRRIPEQMPSRFPNGCASGQGGVKPAPSGKIKKELGVEPPQAQENSGCDPHQEVNRTPGFFCTKSTTRLAINASGFRTAVGNEQGVDGSDETIHPIPSGWPEVALFQ